MKQKRIRKISLLKLVGIVMIVIIFIAGGYSFWNIRYNPNNNYKSEPLLNVLSTPKLSDQYDVIVTGTDPEGVVAAISAARNGLKTLLVDGKNRKILGGLMTVGGLNSLDLNDVRTFPRKLRKLCNHFLNKGIFSEWYEQIEGTSFDTNTAANTFYRMVLAEKNIHLLMQVDRMEPIVHNKGRSGAVVTGLQVSDKHGKQLAFKAPTLIDATQDADVAAAAGAPYSIAREDIGDKHTRMASTLVFKMSGATNDVWKRFLNSPNTNADKRSAWGFAEAKSYVSSQPQLVKIRGLNIGRQNDGTLLFNTMHIFGINPFDHASVQKGLDIGKKEAPRIVHYLVQKYPEFRGMKYAGTAEELYVRESRHLYGEYRLTLADLLENRDHWDAIAYGSYPVDIQCTNAKDSGTVVMQPIQYGVPFRTLVPKNVDGLLVVGRSASFDTIPHGSARVIPLGMATAQAAGAAVKLAKQHAMCVRQLSASQSHIKQLRHLLVQQGMDLTMQNFSKPNYLSHKQYKGLLATASMGIAAGGYENNFGLDKLTTQQSFVYSLCQLKHVHSESMVGSEEQLKQQHIQPKQNLTLEQAIALIHVLVYDQQNDKKLSLHKPIWLQPDTIKTIAKPAQLTKGDTYMLMRDAVKYFCKKTYQ